MPHYSQPPQIPAECYNGNCACYCFNPNTGQGGLMSPDNLLYCNTDNDCIAQCDSWCNTYDHMHFPWEPPQPRPARPRQPYTPGRRGRRRGASTKSSMRRGYNKGGKVNTSNKSRFAGRSQSNPKGKFKK